MKCTKCTEQAANREEMCWDHILQFCCGKWKIARANGTYKKDRCPKHFTSFKHL